MSYDLNSAEDLRAEENDHYWNPHQELDEGWDVFVRCGAIDDCETEEALDGDEEQEMGVSEGVREQPARTGEDES